MRCICRICPTCPFLLRSRCSGGHRIARAEDAALSGAANCLPVAAPGLRGEMRTGSKKRRRAANIERTPTGACKSCGGGAAIDSPEPNTRRLRVCKQCRGQTPAGNSRHRQHRFRRSRQLIRLRHALFTRVGTRHRMTRSGSKRHAQRYS